MLTHSKTLATARGYLKPSPNRASTPTIGNELNAHSGLSLKLDYTCLDEDASPCKITALAREAKELRGASLVVRAEALDTAREVISPHDALKVTAAVGYRESGQLPSAESLLQQVETAKQGQADEIEVFLPHPGSLGEQLQAVVDKAGRTPVRLAVPNTFSDEQLKKACETAQSAGAKFIKTDSPSPSQLALMEAACDLTLVVGGNLVSQAAALPILTAYPKRRLRFATSEGRQVVAQEAQSLSESAPHQNEELQALLSTPGGKKFQKTIASFHQDMVNRIDTAHENGRPVAFMSVCIRPNDVNTVGDNMAVRQGLRETCEKADVAFIDPFELLEPVIAAIKAGEVEGEVIEEVLMDPEAGLWPDLVRRCDAMIHGDRWKFAQGAREEHEMAEYYGIPMWDGSGRPELRGAAGPSLTHVVD